MNRETLTWLGVIVLVAVISLSVFATRILRRPKDLPPTVPPGSSRAEAPAKEQSISSDGNEPSDGEIAKVLGVAPTFQLVDQSGKKFGSADLEGKVWIANFIFTRCTATCPAQTQIMSELQGMLQAGSSGKDVRLLSISVDPEFDQPDVLLEYAKSAGADNDRWRFLTGGRQQIWELSKEGFKLPVKDDAQNAGMPIMHDSKFVLVDRKGQLRGYFNVLEPNGLAGFRRALDHVLPEMSISNNSMTHLAQPPEILSSEWLESRRAEQLNAINATDVFHDFRFINQRSDSGIDFDPQIVDEQRSRLQVNHYDHGNGIAVADIDGDSRLDIYFVTQAGSNALYRNLGGGKFENITERAGVGVPDRISVTASFADIDNDGDADLFVTTVRGGNLLFENDGQGAFHDVSHEAGLDYVGHSSAAVFFDFDRDGWLDLFLTNVGKYTTDEHLSVRIDGTASIPQGDYRYYAGVTDAFAGHLKPDYAETNILYKNLDGKKFKDVTQDVGLVDKTWSGAATPLDVNEDGWPDLYVLSMQGDDEYYENVEGKSFTKKSREVFPGTPWGSMGVKSFDFNNDGRQDLYITDMHSDMSQDVGPELELQKSNMQWPQAFLQSDIEQSIFGNAFFRNDGEGKYQEISDEVGAENYWPWGISVGDVNADGFDDVFVAASMCFPYRYCVNKLLLNETGKRFVAGEFAVGIEPRPADQQLEPWFELDCDAGDSENPICRGRTGKITVWSARGSRTSALFDLDDDGDLDIVTGDFNSPPLVFVSNLSDQHDVNYLKVKLQGTKSNADGLGAVVTLWSGELEMTKVNDGQSGYLSQSRMPLYFGLDQATTVDRIEVNWPSGTKQDIAGPIEASRTLDIVEQ